MICYIGAIKDYVTRTTNIIISVDNITRRFIEVHSEFIGDDVYSITASLIIPNKAESTTSAHKVFDRGSF